MSSILDPRWDTFARVAEAGSFSRAAVLMNMPQSQVSRHITKLETEFGARLFTRTGRGVTLTELGARILPRIRAVKAETEGIADELRASATDPVGEVRVGILPSLIPMAGSLCERVVRRFPRIRLHIEEGSTSQLEEKINDGRLDLATLLREGDHSDGESPVLGLPTLKLVGPISAPEIQSVEIAFRLIASLPLVLPSHPHPLRARLDALVENFDFDLEVRIEADSIRLQHEIVARSGGFAITAGLAGNSYDGRLGETLIVEPILIRSIILVQSPRRPGSLATRTVCQLLQQIPLPSQDR